MQGQVAPREAKWSKQGKAISERLGTDTVGLEQGRYAGSKESNGLFSMR